VTADNVIDGEYSTQGWNRYSYVKNNPVVYKDPTGHKTLIIDMPGDDKNVSEDNYLNALMDNAKTIKGQEKNGIKQTKENSDVYIAKIKDASISEKKRLNSILKDLPSDITEIIFTGAHGDRFTPQMGNKKEGKIIPLDIEGEPLKDKNVKVYMTPCHQGRDTHEKAPEINEWAKKLFGDKDSSKIDGNKFWSYASNNKKLLQDIIENKGNIDDIFQSYKKQNKKRSVTDPDFNNLKKDLIKMGEESWLKKELEKEKR
jgi:hypothetical protein